MVVAIEGTVSEVGLATGPRNGAFVLGAATTPGAELDLHGGLRVGIGAGEAGILEGTDSRAIDRPDQAFLSPVQRVGVEVVKGIVHVEVGTTVVSRSISPREVVCLYDVLLRVGAEPFPIDLIEVVRLEDQASDNTSSLGGPDSHINFAKEDCSDLLVTGPHEVREEAGYVRYLVEEKVGASVFLAMEKTAPRESSYVTSVLPTDSLNKSLAPLVKSMVTFSEPKAFMTGQSGMSQVLEVWAATREDEARATAAAEAILVYILTDGVVRVVGGEVIASS